MKLAYILEGIVMRVFDDTQSRRNPDGTPGRGLSEVPNDCTAGCHTITGTGNGEFTDDLTNKSDLSDPAKRDSCWSNAVDALKDIDWSSVSLTAEERLVVMGERKKMTPSNWDALYTKYPAT